MCCSEERNDIARVRARLLKSNNILAVIQSVLALPGENITDDARKGAIELLEFSRDGLACALKGPLKQER